MKNQIVVFSVVLVLFSFMSCKKDAGSTANTPTTLIKGIATQVTSTVLGNSYNKVNLYYDSKNRITSLVDSANSGNKFLYSYTSDKQFTVDIYGLNVLEIHNLLFLNSNGQEDSSYQYNNTKDTTWEKYTYTYVSGSQISSATDVMVLSDITGAHSTEIVATNYTYDANGNIASTTDNNGIVNSYTYYSNLSYNAPLYVSPIKFYYGNYVKTHTTNESGVTLTASYTYTFDSQNRLSTTKTVTSDGSTTSLTTYTYY